jgi:hypothetical protein
MYMTEGQWDITVPSGTAGWVTPSGSNLPTATFSATQWGRWERGPITSEAGFSLASNSMSLTCIPQPTTVYPNLTIGILNAARNNLFLGATVQVWTAYMPLGEYGKVSEGIETKFLGTIQKTNKLNRTQVVFDVGDPLIIAGLKIPTRLMEPACPWSVTDGNCTLVASGTDVNGYHMTQAFAAASGSTVSSLTPSVSFAQPAGYFTQGVVTCTSGQNAGLSQTVKLHATTLTLMNPFILPVTVGDTFSVLVGCDHTLSTCTAKFGNQANYGGTDFVPPAANAV